MMSNSSLNTQIKRLRKRVRLLFVERYGLFGGAAGAVASSVAVLLALKYDSLINYRLWAALFILGIAAGVVFGLFRRIDNLAIAIAADKRTGLKERLSTALFVMDKDNRDAMDEAQVSDAGEHISGISSSEVFKHRFGTPHISFCVALIVLLSAIILPTVPVFQSRARRGEVTVMKNEGAKLVKIAKDIKKQSRPDQQELKKLGARLEDLGKKMQSGRMQRKDAMLKIRKLSDEVKKQQDLLAKANSGRKSLSQAKLDMQKAGDDLAKKMAEKLAAQKNMSLEDAMKMVPSDKELAELVKKEGPLTSSEQKALEKALGKYADPKNSIPIPKELGAALAKLAENKDYQKAMELMQKLAQKLGSGDMNKADMEALKKQLESLAKALEGTDLDKLAKMMLENAEKLAKMSPEELKKMAQQMAEMQQMAKSLEQAGGG